MYVVCVFLYGLCLLGRRRRFHQRRCRCFVYWLCVWCSMYAVACSSKENENTQTHQHAHTHTQAHCRCNRFITANICSFFSLVRMVEYADIKTRNMYTDFYLCTYMYISCFVRLCLALCLAHISAISKAVVIFVYDFSLILRLFSVFIVMFFISRQSFSCIGFGCVSCFFYFYSPFFLLFRFMFVK